MVDVVFSIFDEKEGPTPIFTTIKDEILAKKISVKSMVSTLINVDKGPMDRLQGEAIIPFPNENKIAFIFFFCLYDQKVMDEENRILSLSVIVDNQKKSRLYNSAIALSQSAIKIKEEITRDYKYTQVLPDKLVDMLINWGRSIEEDEEAILTEKEKVIFRLRELLALFPVKRSFRNYQDPLLPLFAGLMLKIPVVLVGSNEAFLLEVTDLFRKFVPTRVLDVRLLAPPADKSKVKSYKIPKGDLILLNVEQYTLASFYQDPVVIVQMGGMTKCMNYNVPNYAKKVIERTLKKIRGFKDDKMGEHYVEEEMLAFFTKHDQLKEYCSAKKKLGSIRDYVVGDLGTLKDAARFFGVDEDYILTLAESLRVRLEASARTINKMFQNETSFTKMIIKDEKFVGKITN